MKDQIDTNVPTVPLISIIYREHAKFLNGKVKGEDLSLGLYPLLIKTYKNDGIIQEDLAKAFQLNESTITRNLKKMESKGLIERIPYKRKKIIKVTDKGEEIVKKVMDYDAEWDERIRKILGDEDYETYKRLLRKIYEGLI